MSEEKELQGITLRVVESTISFPSSTFLSTVLLSAEVHDPACWERVVGKLDGMVVYPAYTLSETLVEAAQRKARVDAEVLQARIVDLEQQLCAKRAEVSILSRRLSEYLASYGTLVECLQGK